MQVSIVALEKLVIPNGCSGPSWKIEKKGPFGPRGVTLDGIAKKILQELASGPMTSGQIAAACAGGAVRMISPRLVWLEGLGMVESMGPDSYGVTDLGMKFLNMLG